MIFALEVALQIPLEHHLVIKRIFCAHQGVLNTIQCPDSMLSWRFHHQISNLKFLLDMCQRVRAFRLFLSPGLGPPSILLRWDFVITISTSSSMVRIFLDGLCDRLIVMDLLSDCFDYLFFSFQLC